MNLIKVFIALCSVSHCFLSYGQGLEIAKPHENGHFVRLGNDVSSTGDFRLMYLGEDFIQSAGSSGIIAGGLDLKLNPEGGDVVAGNESGESSLKVKMAGRGYHFLDGMVEPSRDGIMLEANVTELVDGMQYRTYIQKWRIYIDATGDLCFSSNGVKKQCISN